MLSELIKFRDPFEASKFQENHFCSGCWNPLIRVPKEDENGKRIYQLACSYCNENINGYIHKNTINYIINKNKIECLEAKNALKQSIDWLKTKKLSESEIMKSLGF